MRPAKAILADLLADETEWWAGELQTITGYYYAEYRELSDRISCPEYHITASDRRLLYGAASALIYCEPPYLEASNVKSLFGACWKKQVCEFLILMQGKK